MISERGGGADRDAATLATFIVTVLPVAYFLGLLFWLAGQFSGLLAGHGWPDSSIGDTAPLLVRLATSPTDPAAAWPESARHSLGPTWVILVLFAVLLGLLGTAGIPLVRLALNFRRRREPRLFRLGFASGREIRQLLSAKAILAKAKSVRPSTRGRRDVEPGDVGYYLGRDRRSRQKLYASVEDVFIILAPPRQGKDVHFCTPFTIDAPGPCIVTSTRADAFTNTYAKRAEMGDIYVFDPNDMTCWPQRLRWSPLSNCEYPLIAANRASALVLSTGLDPTGEGGFFVIGAIEILRAFLHAAAVGGRTVRDVLRWAQQPQNPEPISILRSGEAAGTSAPGWASGLESVTIGGPPRERAGMFSSLNLALACLTDPGVMDACCPPPDERFDLRTFLSGRNTLYVLGKEQKGASVAPLVTAMMEDIFDEARKIASQMPGSRLDPPLTVELNEAAHIAPLPNLPAYMGDSGGFSIALHVYLQSLSQARAKWGDHEANIMWDNAAIRVIMGGAGNVDDLEDISRLMGDYDERKVTSTRGTQRSTATSYERRRVLSPAEVRTLKFGSAVIVARAARPVEAVLTPWWKREDGDEIGAGKSRTEKMVLEYVARAEAARRPSITATDNPPRPERGPLRGGRTRPWPSRQQPDPPAPAPRYRYLQSPDG